METKLGPDHPDTLISRNNLAGVLPGRRPHSSRPSRCTRRRSSCRSRSSAPTTPTRSPAATTSPSAYQAAGRTAEAIALHEATLKACETKLGPDHPDTLTSRNNLAVAYRAAGRTAEAIELHEATLKLCESKLGPDHPDTLASRNNLAMAYQAAGRTAEAIELNEATLRACESKLGPDHPDTLTSRNNLAMAYRAAGRTAEAIALLEATLKRDGVEARSRPPRHAHHPQQPPIGLRGRRPDRRGRAAPSRYPGPGSEVVRARRPPHRRRHGPARQEPPPATRWADAEPVLRECLTIRAKVKPDDWSTFNSRSQLGGSLAGQKKYAEAEPLILAGYEGLKAREAKLPPSAIARLPEAADRVIELYLSWGKAEEAARWRARLAPGSPAERVGFAEMSYDRKRYATAARLWSEALEADPNLGEDRRAGHRYNAACAAALAAAGKGVDEPPPDEAVKARLRGQALGWLQAELAAWSRELETGPAQGRPAIAKALDHWQYDPDLEGIRDARAPVNFPEAERKERQSLWATYASLLERARGKTP